MGIFIVSNGFALTLLFPTHLHPHSDAAAADSEATMYNMSNPVAVSETVGTVSCHDIAAIWVAFFSTWQRYRC